MELLTEKKSRSKTSIPVIGKESASGSTDRYYEIALRAYYKAEARGYEPGHEIQDWLDAEAEVMAEIEMDKSK
jgi:Protein of unknown function (DUF2934)